MSLKSIRESYSNLLNVFETAGVKFSESQKSDLDTFVLALESKMNEQRQTAIRQTKAAVEKKMEREYKEVFENIMDGMRRNSELAAKIQDKITQLNEQKKIATKVNDYLDLYVESVLPKKTIVDYDRMQKLEKLHESLKDVLVVSDDLIAEKVEQLEHDYKIKQSKCETEVAKMRVKLDESMKSSLQMKSKLEKYEAKALLESKLADLPTYEASRVRRVLLNSTSAEIEKKFTQVLESVRRRVNEETAADKVETEQTIEGEIKDILEKDEGSDIKPVVKEDDLLKNRSHNLHKDVKPVAEAELSQEELDDIAEITGNIYTNDSRGAGSYEPRRTPQSGKQVDDQLAAIRAQNPDDFDVREDEEDFETMEEVKMTNDGEVQLDESDIIDSSLMKMWCNRSVCID